MHQSVFFHAIVIDYQIFNNYTELPNNWDALVYHDLFLQTPYLKALEKASPANINIYYIGFFSHSDLIGVAIVQRVQLYLNDIFRNDNDSCFKERFKSLVSKVLKGNILVIGNLTHTGQHGVHFYTEKHNYTDFLEALFKATTQLKRNIKNQHNKKIRAYLLKDYFTNDVFNNHTKELDAFGCHQLTVQPNMILHIKPQWKSFDDYIFDLTKKYRDRYKSARKKAKQIEKRELNLLEVEKESKTLYKLYKSVSDHAKINTFILPENHFLEYKKQLGDNFKIFGYYLENTLVGFYTLILNHNDLETYFLGYDTTHQYKYKLYLNMLFDMLEFGIENRFKNVVYARTAMAIKSSVGAKPYKMHMYLKHTNWFMNALLKNIFRLMNPKQNWEERHPFK